LTSRGWLAVAKAHAGESDPFGDNLDREEVLDLLEEVLEEAHRKATNGRVRDAENEKVRIQWIKAVGYLVGQYRQLVRDKDLEELKAEVAELKASEDIPE
jgi:hypothetical protein